MDRKIPNSPIIALLTIVIIIAILSLTYIYWFMPFLERTIPHDYSWVKIEGNIYPDNKMSLLLDSDFETYVNNKPKYVFVYYDFYNLDRLCYGNRVSLIEIEWTNETYGKYSASFEIPFNITVILTTECAGCNSERFEINKNIPEHCKYKSP